MDMRPVAPDRGAADLTPAVEPVFSTPGRIHEAVFVNLDFGEGDMAALAECAAIYGSETLATIARQTGRRLARIRAELEAVRGGEARHA